MGYLHCGHWLSILQIINIFIMLSININAYFHMLLQNLSYFHFTFFPIIHPFWQIVATIFVAYTCLWCHLPKKDINEVKICNIGFMLFTTTYSTSVCDVFRSLHPLQSNHVCPTLLTANPSPILVYMWVLPDKLYF